MGFILLMVLAMIPIQNEVSILLKIHCGFHLLMVLEMVPIHDGVSILLKIHTLENYMCGGFHKFLSLLTPCKANEAYSVQNVSVCLLGKDRGHGLLEKNEVPCILFEAV